MSRAILADHARALVIELPSWHEKLHCTRVIANTQPSLIVERMRTFHLLQIDLHTQPVRSGTRMLPSSIRSGSLVRRCPSCHIQCVSMAVILPGAAAATCVIIASETSK